jgi:predicted ATPase
MLSKLHVQHYKSLFDTEIDLEPLTVFIGPNGSGKSNICESLAVEPHQVRAVELDGEGKTQVHNLPIDSVRFQKALEAYDGDLGELWFTNVFGGNPE